MPMAADRTCLITWVIVLNHQIPPSLRGGEEAMHMAAYDNMQTIIGPIFAKFLAKKCHTSDFS